MAESTISQSAFHARRLGILDKQRKPSVKPIISTGQDHGLGGDFMLECLLLQTLPRWV
jgi:hypothetical protein